MTSRRLARVRHNDRILPVEIQGDQARVLTAFLPSETGAAPEPTGEVLDLADVTRLAPVTPSKVVAVALNYRLHAEELGRTLPEEPLFFLKPSTTVIGPGEAIRLPKDSSEVHHEAEVGMVLSRTLTRASVEEARESLLGITAANDVTARDLQRSIGHFTRSKGYDTFCPIGPEIVTGLDPNNLQVACRVNGKTTQDGNSSDMIFDAWKLLSFISHVMTLNAGDVVITGTPAGVGPIRAGDVVEVEIEGVGVLSNPVVAD